MLTKGLVWLRLLGNSSVPLTMQHQSKLGPLCLLALPLKAHLSLLPGLLFIRMFIPCEMLSGSTFLWYLLWGTQYIMKKLSYWPPAIPMRQYSFLVLYIPVSKERSQRQFPQTWRLSNPDLESISYSFTFSASLKLCTLFSALGLWPRQLYLDQ